MLVRDVMSQPAITVPADLSCTRAVELLVRHGFTAAPVVNDDDALIGIVTEADLLRGRILTDPRRGDPHHIARFGPKPPAVVAEVMTTPVESLTPGADASDAVRIMLDERIRCLPVVDGHGVVGVITRRDLLRASLVSNDHELRVRIIDRLGLVGPSGRWSVSVQAGVADIGDHIDDAADRTAAVRIAAAVPGVVHAEAHYETSDPF